MAAAMGQRSVEFDAQPAGAYAVQLRLTPALLEALLRAQEEGQAASIRFGAGPQGNAISVGDVTFRFNAAPEGSCDLLHVPAAGSGSRPSLVGAVRQKLLVARNMEDERVRVRARGEEAERRGQERKAQLLDGKPAGGGRSAAAATTLRRVTPPPPSLPGGGGSGAPPRPRGPTPPPALTASMLAVPTGRPPTHPAPTAAPPPAAQPAPAAKPIHKSASAGKLGLTSKSNSAASLGAGSLQLAASTRVLQAARAGSPMRLILIAILAERPMSLNAVKAVLADAAARVKAFKAPKKEELERTIKAVAEFKTPGVYVLYPVLRSELDSLPAAPAGGAEGGGGGGGGNRRRSRSTTPPEATQGPSPQAPGSGVKPKKAAATAAAAAGGGAATDGRKAASGKRGRLDWTDDDSDAEEQPPAAQRVRWQPAPAPHVKAASEPAAALPHGSAGSPASVGGGPGGSGSSGGHAAAAGGGGGRATRRTSSSRGSDRADESWIEEHATRQPEPAAPINSKEEYRAREAAFTSKYEVYFKLHQLIEAHKKDFEALGAAIDAAPTEAERERHRAELEKLHQRRGERAKRWDSAYRVLHQELAAAKSRMAEYVQRLQAQQAQQAGRGAAPALPAVRVK